MFTIQIYKKKNLPINDKTDFKFSHDTMKINIRKYFMIKIPNFTVIKLKKKNNKKNNHKIY